MPADLVEPPPSAGLPELPPIDLVLITNPRAAKEPAEALTAAILGSNAPLKPDAVLDPQAPARSARHRATPA
jgi:hypothetical protein